MKHPRNINYINNLVISVFRLNNSLLTVGERIAKEHGLTTAKWKILGGLILADRALTVPQIANNMGLSRQAVQRLINILVDEFMVIEMKNQSHKKSTLFEITPIGKKCYFDINKDWEKEVNKWEIEMSSLEFDILTKNIEKFQEVVEQKNFIEG